MSFTNKMYNRKVPVINFKKLYQWVCTPVNVFGVYTFVKLS